MNIRSKILGIYTFALFCVLSAVVYVSYPYLRTSQGTETVRIFIAVMLIVGAMSMFLSAALLEIIVIRRISDLTEQVNHIKDYRSFYYKLKFKGGDEVAALASAINQMLERIVGSTNEVSELNTELQQEKADEEKLVVERTKQLSFEKARLHASVTNLSLGFIMTDAKNIILLINERAKTILTSKTPVGESAQTGAQQDNREWSVADINESFGDDFDVQKLLDASMQKGMVVDQNQAISSGRILRVLISPIIEDEQKSPIGCVMLLEDITEQEILDRSKDEFLSIASHELRTPLTAIRGNTAMIKQFYEAQVHDETFNEMVEDIHASSVRLISIVNDFLDASRLEQGKIKFDMVAFDLTEVMENVVYETVALAKEKGNQIVIDKTLKNLPEVLADKDRVKQVIYNLVGNAMKFTEKGTITISATKLNGMVKVMVTDTGPGIPLEGQKLLFRKFQQAGNSVFTRDTSRGTGLGLYISKLLIEHMGGTIGLDHSEVGKGTTFAFTLPLASGAGA